MTAPTPVVDWSHRYGALGGTTSVASAAAAAAAVGDLLGWPPLWPVLAGVGGTALLVLADRVHQPAGEGERTIRRRLLRLWAAAWLAGAGWCAYVYEFGTVLSSQVWPPFLAAVVLFAIAALILTPRPAPHTGPAGVAVATALRPHMDWEQRLAKLCRITPPTVVSATDWPTGNGYTLTGVFAGDGTTWQQLRQYEPSIAAVLRLPHGCGVEFDQGADRGGFTLRVNTRDAMATDRPYPADLTPLSILGPIPLGWHRDDDLTEVHLRERCVMLAGETGSGKTNELQIINAGYCRCPDVLLWHIDMNGAAMSLPWLSPWFDGAVARPAVDWVASTPAEATRMVEYATAIALRRRVAYRQLMADQDTDLVPVSPAIPLIRIVMDEGAEATGLEANPKLRDGIVRLIELGRAAGVRVDLCVLRPTADIVPTRAKRQLGVRLGMAVTDPEDANHLYGWKFNPDPADTPYKGSGLIRVGGVGAPRPFRGWHTALPRTIYRIAVECADRRPVLDAPSAGTGPARDVYERRWERTLPWLRDATGDAPGDAPGDARDAPAASPGDAGSASQEGMDFSAVRRAIDAAKGTLTAATPPAAPAEDEVWASLVERLTADPADTAVGSEAERPWLPVAVQLLAGAGPAGLTYEQLAAALAEQQLTPSRATVYRQLGTHPDVVKLARGFAHTRAVGG